MKAAEKLLQDIAYWEDQAKEARAALRIAESVLPGLHQSLEDLKGFEALDRDRADQDREVVASVPAGSPALDGKPQVPAELAERARAAGAIVSKAGTIRLRGQCEDRVDQALHIKSPQSPEDLAKFLQEHGRGYSRGAINYALRKLRDQGKIQEVKKEGNLRFYAPVEAEAQAAS